MGQEAGNNSMEELWKIISIKLLFEHFLTLSLVFLLIIFLLVIFVN